MVLSFTLCFNKQTTHTLLSLHARGKIELSGLWVRHVRDDVSVHDDEVSELTLIQPVALLVLYALSSSVELEEEPDDCVG